MATVSGDWSTQNVVSGERPLDWSSKLNILIPNIARFTTLITKVSTGESLSDPEFNVWEQDDLALVGTLDEAMDTSETAMTVTDSTVFRVGDIIEAKTTTAATYETMYVSAIVDATTLTVIRGFGGTAGTAQDTGTPLYIIDNVSPEASSKPEARASQMTKRTNYAEIIRATADTSNTMLGTLTRPELQKGALHRRNLMFALRRIKMQMETSAFFGQAKESTAVTPVIRKTGGVYEFVNSGNKVNAAGPLTFEHINALAGLVYDQGTPELDGAVLIVSPAIRRKLSELVVATGIIRNDEQKSSKWGFRVETIVTPWGDLPLVQSSALRGSGGANVTRGATGFDLHGDKAFLIKMPLFKIRWFRPLTLKTDIQAPDYDGKIDGYIGEYGFERRCPKAHAVLYGVTG